jgi:hypothetical protein
MPTLDFGFNANPTDSGTEPITDLDTGVTGTVGSDGNIIPPIDEPNNDDPKNNNKTDGDGRNNNVDTTVNNTDDKNNNNNDNQVDDNDLVVEPGSVITIGEDTYTVDAEGNLIDKNNKVFKEAKDVKDFLKQFEVDDTDDKENAIDVAKIIEKVGFEVTDENDKPITFENTPDGVASYINEVLDAKRTEYAQAGVQQLIDKFPIVSDFLNYYVANGNSYEGFGQVRDRSTIVIDENNTAQQEAIVREAFKESGKVGSIDDYISFLKSTNRLLDAAKQDLATLQENDKRVKAEQAEAAQRKIEEDKKAEIAYWGKVKSAIDKKEIAGYKIPETILINKNGKQSAATADDFFNYLYQVDDKGYSRYERELMETPEEEQLQNDLLRAYLKFTGGNYSNLVDLAIASEKTKTLRLKAAEQRRKSSIKITKPAANKKIGDNIADVLGYV